MACYGGGDKQMISEEKKFIFIHVPKAGGTTIEHHILEYAKDCSYGCSWARRTKNFRNKGMFDLLKNHPDYFSFSFVRNPFSRAVSLWKRNSDLNQLDFNVFLERAYKFVKSKPESYFYNQEDNRTNITRKDFFEKIPYEFHDSGSIGYHLLPQKYFFINGCDFIGSIENFQSDWDYVCKKVGIPPSELFHKNKSAKKKHFSEYYDESAKEMLIDMYQDDFTFLKENGFNYSLND